MISFTNSSTSSLNHIGKNLCVSAWLHLKSVNLCFNFVRLLQLAQQRNIILLNKSSQAQKSLSITNITTITIKQHILFVFNLHNLTSFAFKVEISLPFHSTLFALARKFFKCVWLFNYVPVIGQQVVNLQVHEGKLMFTLPNVGTFFPTQR